MIRVQKIKLKNFMSVGNQFIEVELDKHSTTLIIGKNGSGKSQMFMDAITYGLFNKPFRKFNLPRLVNSTNKEDCVVEIEFETNGKRYKIVRGMAPKIFEIWVDGVLVPQNDMSVDYQDYLEEKILRMSYKTFCQIAILGSKYVQFMALTPADRRIVVEDVLNLQVVSDMMKLLKLNHTKFKEQLQGLDAEIDKYKSMIELQKKNDDIIKESLRKRIEEIKVKNSDCDKRIGLLADKRDVCLNLKVQLLATPVSAIEESQVALNKLRKAQTYAEITIGKASKEIQFFNEHDVCPTCFQNIQPEWKEKTKNYQIDSIAAITSKIPKLEGDIKHLESLIAAARSHTEKVAANQRELDSINREVSTYTLLKTNNSNEIHRLELELTIPEPKKEGMNLDELEFKLTDLIGQREVLVHKIDVSNISNLVLKESGFKSQIIKTWLPLINSKINEYLSLFGFNVNFTIDENFDETIKSRNRSEFVYQSFSEGEKGRIDLAILMAWRSVAEAKNSVNLNLLVLDEVLDSSLDAGGVENLAKILKNLGKNVNVVVISHRSENGSEKFDRTFETKKIDGFTKLTLIS